MKKIINVIILILMMVVLSSCNLLGSDEVRLTFDNGDGVVIYEIVQAPLTKVVLPEEPVKAGYFFVGWDKTVPVIMPDKNMNFSALWIKADDGLFRVTFKIQGHADLIFYYQYQEEIMIPEDPHIEGFVFGGWDKEIPTLMPAKDLVFVAQLQTNTSSNPEVNAVYNLLNQLYYQELPLDLSKITKVDQLYQYLDPYTFLYQADTRAIDQEENYVGLGITVNQLPEGLLVVDINLNSAIDEYLYVGDLIVSVDGIYLAEVEFDERVPLIRGEVGEKKVIGIKRMGESHQFEFTLADINNESVTKKLFDNVGYLYINRFGPDTATKFNQELKSLENENITELIIDVRNDGGGYLDAVVAILRNFIVKNDPFLTIYNVKAENKRTYSPVLNEKKPYHITVLVNENSASASEVLAEALKQEGYDVFGTVTYGKDVYQAGYLIGQMYPDLFASDIVLNVTLGYWYPANEKRVTEGVTPTITHPQTGILSLSYPALTKTFKRGDSDSVIETYQYLGNLTVPHNYERGLFNETFENALKSYQENNNLSITGELDLSTEMHLIDYYRTLIKDSSYDNQLNSLLALLTK